MTDADLKARVAELLRDDRTSPTTYDEALRKLREFASAIEASLKPDVIKVVVEPGHLVNRGQQYSFVFRASDLNLRDVLFRAYLPVDGFPVTLDLFEDEHPECKDVEELETAVLGFLADPAVKQRLLAIKDLAA